MPEVTERTGEKNKYDVFELRGEKKELVYSGTPIDVYLSDTHLQILDVKNDPMWNADYILVDPMTFDPAFPKEGYKGIRENEPVILGRLHPSRFRFPLTVSRNHLKIELKNGTLEVEDLNSKNGTTIVAHRLQRFENKVSETGIREYPAVKKFFEYAEANEEKIERQFETGRDLWEMFYRDFYNSDKELAKYKEDNPVTKEIGGLYEKNIGKLYSELSAEGDSDRIISSNGYWCYAVINGGFRAPDSLGRFYLNIKPSFVSQIFKEAIDEFRAAGLHIQTKIPMRGEASDLNRLDKMVLYFDESEGKEALGLMETIYKKYPEAFEDTGTPRFTRELKGADGKAMSGIAFGEEPKNHNESFGTLRCRILGDIYREAKRAKLKMSDPKFNFERAFRFACEKYQIDPSDPAFNIDSAKKGKLSAIRERI